MLQLDADVASEAFSKAHQTSRSRVRSRVRSHLRNRMRSRLHQRARDDEFSLDESADLSLKEMAHHEIQSEQISEQAQNPDTQLTDTSVSEENPADLTTVIENRETASQAADRTLDRQEQVEALTESRAGSAPSDSEGSI